MRPHPRLLLPACFALFASAAALVQYAGGVPSGTAAAPPDAGAPQGLAPGADLETAYHHNNLGVAHMEQHHYGRAAEEFRRTTGLAPGWALGHVNLGIALYSSHQNDGAEAAFRRALAIEPASPHALYGIGLIHKVRGEREPALAAFSRVAEIDPQDADARYNLGLLCQWNQQWDESARHLREAMALDPTNISAVYKLATALLNSGKTAEGQALMEQFRKMSADPSLGTTRGLQYGEQGRYAEVATEPPLRAAGGSAAPPQTTVRFVDAAAAAGLTFRHLGSGEDLPAPGGEAGSPDSADDPRRTGSGVGIGDADGDGDLDLCFADVGGDKGPALRLLLNDGKMKFSEAAAAAGLQAHGLGMGCYFGDVDNDRDLDLLLSGTPGLRLFRNEGSGTFKETTLEAGLEEASPAAGAAFADLDHDGDLDIAVTGRVASARASPAGAAGVDPAPAGPGVVHWINVDGKRFVPASALNDPGLNAGRGTAVTFSDFDNDRDIDFIVTDSAGPPRLFSNLRGGRWEEVAGARGLGRIPGAVSAATADLDKDGFMDLALAGASPALLWRNEAGRAFAPLKPQGLPAAPAALGPVFVDFDNDGFIDLFATAAGKAPLLLWRNLGNGRFADASSSLPVSATQWRGLRGAAAGDLDGDGDADLVVTRSGDAPLLLRNDGGNARRWLRVRPVGLNSVRQGIGTKVEVQAGGLWQKAEVNGGSGYLSQGPAEVLFGLGERPGAEFVRLLWPGGVLQSELEIAAGRSLAVEELDRKGSSCPVLYAWDGARFTFVADFIGGGGIGFLTSPGRYTHPDPTEYVKIAAGQLQPRGGRLELRVVQQLEEVAYIDRLELIAVDHRSETEIYPNERFMTGPPHPEFEVYEVAEKVLPQIVKDGAGRDITGRLARIDRIYAGDLDLLPWPGYAEQHRLLLSFSPRLEGAGWRLFLDGWVDYGYSHANYAAAQAGVALHPPRLSRTVSETAWEDLASNMGYPAGLSRTMVAGPEIRWPGETQGLAIDTNMRIYWDHVFLARPRRLDTRALPRLQAAGAELRFLGFPREFSPDGRKPYLYDYALAASSFPWKNMRGSFTRYGDVRELLLASDDRFVVMNRGDEIALHFDARRLPELKPGWKRDYLLFADGYAKDMDPHGAFPDTVEPLPFHAMSAYPYDRTENYPQDAAHRDYLRRWNTRENWQ